MNYKSSNSTGEPRAFWFEFGVPHPSAFGRVGPFGLFFVFVLDSTSFDAVRRGNEESQNPHPSKNRKDGAPAGSNGPAQFEISSMLSHDFKGGAFRGRVVQPLLVLRRR
jgi:hypothetical protein